MYCHNNAPASAMLVVLACLILSSLVTAEVSTYPAYPNEPASTVFSVTADGRAVLAHSCAGFQSGCDYARFAFTGNSVTVAVTLTSGTLGSYAIHPTAYNVASTKSGNTFTFTLDKPRKLIVTGLSRKLAIFAERPETNPPKIGDANVKNIRDYNVDTTGATLVTTQINTAVSDASALTGGGIVYFPPGVYYTGTITMKSNTKLYVAAGALIKSSTSARPVIAFTNISNAGIQGRGTITESGDARHSSGGGTNSYTPTTCTNLLFDGIILLDSYEWTLVVTDCDHFTATNVKIINEDQYWWDDGFCSNESRHVLFADGFFYGADDATTVKGASRIGTANDSVTFRNMVLYTNANGLRFGFSGELNWSYAKNVFFDSVNVVSYGFQEAAFKMETEGTTVDNVNFTNCSVDNAGPLIYFNTVSSAHVNFNGLRVAGSGININTNSTQVAMTCLTVNGTAINSVAQARTAGVTINGNPTISACTPVVNQIPPRTAIHEGSVRSIAIERGNLVVRATGRFSVEVFSAMGRSLCKQTGTDGIVVPLNNVESSKIIVVRVRLSAGSLTTANIVNR